MTVNLLESLMMDKATRDYYVEDHVTNGVPAQIKALRVCHGWTQKEFGRRAGITAQRVSQIEDPSYGPLSLNVLRQVASAFDLALIVKFGSFTELVELPAFRPLPK